MASIVELVRRELAATPITETTSMMANAQDVFLAVRNELAPLVQACDIARAIESETGIALIQGVDNAMLTLRRLRPYIWSRLIHGNSYRALRHWWALRALAIDYGNDDRHSWLVADIVKASIIDRCFGCERKLKRGHVGFYPVDTLDFYTLAKLADKNQLELRYFCSQECEGSERRWLKEAKQKHQQLKQLIRPRLRVSP